MTIAHEQEYQLRTGDFDRYEHVQPASVLDVFQDIAGISADNTPSMSYEEMKARGYFWAITRIKYEVMRQPKMHERVIGRTWPLAPSRAGFQREYTIRSLSDELLVRGTSKWIVMDFANRSLVNAADVYQGPDDFSDETTFPDKLRKLKTIEPQGEPVRCTPAYTDIDLNGHVNNIRYANFALNAFGEGAARGVKTLQIDYRHEVQLGQTLEIYTATRETGEAVAQGMLEDGSLSFVCQFEFA
ncbi:MAG: acyl-[acyl-carrier-protein] thioesterase [Coriobacteriales bacterium]|jgi:medium-chain acyl-[acyl-carrier-protein] hydrolase